MVAILRSILCVKSSFATSGVILTQTYVQYHRRMRWYLSLSWVRIAVDGANLKLPHNISPNNLNITLSFSAEIETDSQISFSLVQKIRDRLIFPFILCRKIETDYPISIISALKVRDRLWNFLYLLWEWIIWQAKWIILTANSRQFHGPTLIIALNFTAQAAFWGSNHHSYVTLHQPKLKLAAFTPRFEFGAGLMSGEPPDYNPKLKMLAQYQLKNTIFTAF